MTDSDYEPPCERKIPYEEESTAAMAMQIAQELSGSSGRGENTYLCPHCGKWHWGHKRGRKPNAKRRAKKRQLRLLKKHQHYWKIQKGR